MVKEDGALPGLWQIRFWIVSASKYGGQRLAVVGETAREDHVAEGLATASRPDAGELIIGGVDALKTAARAAR